MIRAVNRDEMRFSLVEVDICWTSAHQAFLISIISWERERRGHSSRQEDS